MKLYIAVGSAMLLMMTMFIILFVAFYQNRQVRHQLALNELREAYRKELMEATFNGQEVERRRLARDLHDEIGTMLSVTKLSLNQLERKLSDTAENSLQVQKTRSLLDETMSNVRRISRNLVPTTLERFGLLAAIEELTEKATGPDVSVLLESPNTLERIAPAQELMFYRIAQELINNAIKHAGATQVEVQFVYLDDSVRMSVLDNGRGFDYDEAVKDRRSGLGLRNIESRLSVVDGHVTFDVAPGRGSRIHVQTRLHTAPSEEIVSSSGNGERQWQRLN
ncbi:sensor histidine kinase [Fibrella forsythiae]|uniref:histidine kinase n=1 Tax=Fibrella forsythiae TaxID=2817061 RepID=A0ABS3JET1_9BACT|nr:sensor histidine kinase [Fibrella forsythiae]MBO0948519.1 sensor histidine kinase [Fibrella forsythiae]